jgi:hypothetical protein
MKTPEPELFRSGRQFTAWIGLTPKTGKVRLGESREPATKDCAVCWWSGLPP